MSFKLLAGFFLQQMMGWWWDVSCLLSWYTWSNEKDPGKVETKQQEWAKSWISRRSVTSKSCQGCILKCCNANQKERHTETKRSLLIKTHDREITERQASALHHFLFPPSLLQCCCSKVCSAASLFLYGALFGRRKWMQTHYSMCLLIIGSTSRLGWYQ